MFNHRFSSFLALFGLLALSALVLIPSLRAQTPSGNGGFLTIDNPVSVHSVTNGTLNIDGRAGGAHLWTDVCAENINGEPTELIWTRSQLINPVNYTVTLESSGQEQQTGTFSLTQTHGEEVTSDQCGNSDEGINFRYTFAFSVDVSTLSPGLYRLTTETSDDILGSQITDSFLFAIDNPVLPAPAIQTSVNTISMNYQVGDNSPTYAYLIRNVGDQGSLMGWDGFGDTANGKFWLRLGDNTSGTNLTSNSAVTATIRLDLEGNVEFGQNRGTITELCSNARSGPSCAVPSALIDVIYTINPPEVNLQAQPVQ